MAFQDRAQGICSQLHLTAVRRPVFIGVGLLLGLVLVAALLLLLFPQSSVFEIRSAEQMLEDVTTAESIKGTEEQPAAEVTSSGGEAGISDATILPDGGEQPKLCVHVDGKVASPGVYYLEAGSRVIDAVEAAGGLAEGACTEAVNLAQGLQDGEQVLIPDAESIAEGAPASSSSAAAASPAAAASGLVSINTADAAALQTLPGIGQATAEKIIADREANGAFASLEDLKRVSGIGDKKFEALRDAICL